MSANDPSGNPANSNPGGNPDSNPDSNPSSTAPPVPRRQLDPGTFEVMSRNRSSGVGTGVGWVFVVDGANNLTVEHWALKPAYSSPSSTQDMVVVKVASGYESFADFLEAMQELNNEGANFRYVRSDSYAFVDLPE